MAIMKDLKVGILIVIFSTRTTLALISQLPSTFFFHHHQLAIYKSNHKLYPSSLLLSLFPQQQNQQNQQNQNDNNDGYFLYNNINLIAKTNESFKLSDLYMMEANIQSNVREWDKSTRIIMDPNTGSCLFTLDKRFCSDDCIDIDDNRGITSDYYVQPSIIHRCDWICEVLAFGHDINEFLNVIESSSKNKAKWSNRNICLNNFSLDYSFMGKKVTTGDNCQSYTSKSLSFRIVQLLSPAQNALDPNKASVELLIIDTPKGIFLGLKKKLNMTQRKKNEGLLKKWATRPFQYSSAMNPMVAMIVVDIIKDITIEYQRKQSSLSSSPLYTNDIKNKLSKTITMIDVTCGSGTFLAFSMDRGMNVCGIDVNDKCVSGSNDNLEFLLGTEDTKDRSHVEIGDSSKNVNVNDDDDMIFDCAISNMPWGQNTNMNVEENKVRDFKNVFIFSFVRKYDISLILWLQQYYRSANSSSFKKKTKKWSVLCFCYKR